MLLPGLYGASRNGVLQQLRAILVFLHDIDNQRLAQHRWIHARNGTDRMPGVEGPDEHDGLVGCELEGIDDVHFIELRMAIDPVVVKTFVPGTVETGAGTPLRVPLAFIQHGNNKGHEFAPCIGMWWYHAAIVRQCGKFKTCRQWRLAGADAAVLQGLDAFITHSLRFGNPIPRSISRSFSAVIASSMKLPRVIHAWKSRHTGLALMKP